MRNTSAAFPNNYISDPKDYGVTFKQKDLSQLFCDTTRVALEKEGLQTP